MANKTPTLLPRIQRILEELGENLRLARLRRKLSTTQVAERAGMGRSTLVKIEQGHPGYGIGYEGKKFQGGIGSTYFYSGETSQQTGQIYAGGGKWKITYENDTWAPVPGLIIPGGAEVDKYRTAALRFDITGGRLEGAKAGFSIFTGESDGRRNPDGSFRETSEGYRLGAIYLGYKNYKVGYNSERNIRGPIQNGFHDLMDYPHFQVLDINDKFYGGYYSTNPYTLW